MNATTDAFAPLNQSRQDRQGSEAEGWGRHYHSGRHGLNSGTGDLLRRINHPSNLDFDVEAQSMEDEMAQPVFSSGSLDASYERPCKTRRKEAPAAREE